MSQSSEENMEGKGAEVAVLLSYANHHESFAEEDSGVGDEVVLA